MSLAAVRTLTKRIESIGKTRQITRAMKLVAASKMRRAEERITNARVYGGAIHELLAKVSASTSSGGGESAAHPLMEIREVKTVKVLVVASDKGLCGAFNQNVCKQAAKKAKELEKSGQSVHLEFIGKKTFEILRKLPFPQDARQVEAVGANIPPLARETADRLMKEFLNGEVDEVIIFFNRFISVAKQIIIQERLLPVGAPTEDKSAEADSPDSSSDSTNTPIFEPSPDAIFKALVPASIRVTLQNALADSEASEHAARMVSMENATNNASELIDDLTLVRNNIRQAAITSEIVEIVSSAEALRAAE